HLLRGGWLHTGDIGRLDREGYLYVVGRRDNTVVSGGENVSLEEVEEVLNSHPQVADAGAVGLPHPVWDQVVGAGVVVADGASLNIDDLMEFCRGHLAPYKLPNSLHVLPELPRNALGKLSRAALREILVQKSPH
ncbi:MAG: AMP-binding protein, partial [Dehalococcoidia bacterium]|nr:AMP-binding protein [Dehalococcoidia bacterium]